LQIDLLLRRSSSTKLGVSNGASSVILTGRNVDVIIAIPVGLQGCAQTTYELEFATGLGRVLFYERRKFLSETVLVQE